MKYGTFVIVLILLVGAVIYTRDIPSGFRHLLAGIHTIMQGLIYAQFKATRVKSYDHSIRD